MSTTTISTRIDSKSKKEIDQIIKQIGLDRSAFLKQLILSGLKDFKIKTALEKYKNLDVSLSRAAEIAEVSIYDFLFLMEKQKIDLNYSPEDLKSDLAVLKNV